MTNSTRPLELTHMCGYLFGSRYFEMTSKDVKPILKALHPLFYEAEYMIKRAIIDKSKVSEPAEKYNVSIETFTKVCLMLLGKIGYRFDTIQKVPNFEALLSQLFMKYIKSRGNFRGFKLVSVPNTSKIKTFRSRKFDLKKYSKSSIVKQRKPLQTKQISNIESYQNVMVLPNFNNLVSCSKTQERMRVTNILNKENTNDPKAWSKLV